MKILWLILIFFSLSNSSFGQSDLKKIIVNKKQIISSDWEKEIQENGKWEHIKTATVRGKRVKKIISKNYSRIWAFGKSNLDITPYYWKENRTEYSNFSINYFKANKIIVISTTVQSGDRSFERKEIYKVINLTNEYLILEEIKDTYCFDYSEGRKLTKKECKEKASKEPKRLFGGKEINIGRKPPKYRLVFKLKK
jgi:hypothetical protein